MAIIFALFYALTNDHYGKVYLMDREGNSLDEWTIQLDSCFLTVIGLTFVVPLAYRACEAWSNAVMS